MIEGPLIERLLTDTGLAAVVGSRIWPDDAEPDTTDPYLVVRLMGLDRVVTCDGVLDERGETVELWAFAVRRLDAQRAAELVDTNLEALAVLAATRSNSRVLAGRAVLGAFPRSGEADSDPPVNAASRGLRWARREWMIWHQAAGSVGT